MIMSSKLISIGLTLVVVLSSSLVQKKSSFTEDDVFGTWVLAKEVYDNSKENKRVSDLIAKGLFGDTLIFKKDMTYEDRYGQPFIGTGEWYVVKNRIQTKNSRYEPPSSDGVLWPDTYFDNVEIQGEKMSMTARSEFIGKSYYKKIK